MSMTRKITIDGKEVPFRASAAVPRIYRIKFHRDIYKDLSALEKSIGDSESENSNLDLFSLELFEARRPCHPGHAGGMAGRFRHVLHLPGTPTAH